MNATSIVKKALKKDRPRKTLVNKLAEIAKDAREKGFSWIEIQEIFQKHQIKISTATLRNKIKEMKVLA